MLEYALQPLSMLFKGIFGSRGNFDTAFNLGSDIESQIYNRSLQDRLFMRDDNAIQRMAKDYEAAGFNPLLAVGGTGSANTKAFESSGLEVDTLGKEYQEKELDNLESQKDLLDEQILDLRKTSSRNAKLDNAKIRRNKYIAKLLDIKDAPDGVDISDYDVKDLILLRTLDKGEDAIKGATSSTSSEEDNAYELYKQKNYNYNSLSEKEKKSVDLTLKEKRKGVQKVLKRYDNDGRLYLSVENGSAKAFYIDYTKYGVLLYNGDSQYVFYNDRDFYNWLNENKYKAIKK